MRRLTGRKDHFARAPGDPSDVLWAAAALLEMVDDGFAFLEYRCEWLHDVKELLDHLEKSSQVIKQAVAVLSVFRHDGFDSKSVLEESLHVVFRSKPVVSESTDVGFKPRA